MAVQSSVVIPTYTKTIPTLDNQVGASTWYVVEWSDSRNGHDKGTTDARVAREQASRVFDEAIRVGYAVQRNTPGVGCVLRKRGARNVTKKITFAVVDK